jgi:hypothetical protein
MPVFQILTAATGGSDRGPHARLAGRCADGTSVAVTVRGAFPFLYLKLSGTALLRDGAPDQALLEALRHNLDAHLNRRVRPEHKHSVDAKPGRGDRPWYTLVKSVECVRAHDFYGYSAQKHHYAKFTFSSVGARDEARFALTAPAGGAKRKPPFRLDVLKRLFPGRDKDVHDAYAEDGRRVNRRDMGFVLAEANIELHDQVGGQAPHNPRVC